MTHKGWGIEDVKLTLAQLAQDQGSTDVCYPLSRVTDLTIFLLVEEYSHTVGI